MKSKIYIVIHSVILTVLICLPREVYSGGSPWYSPSEYYTFRIYDDSKLYDYNEDGERLPKSTTIQNCELWQRLTSTDIPLKDIHSVVYRYSSKEILRITHLIEGSANDTLMRNQFIRWIVLHKDREIAECLSLAKLCEEIRMEQNDPWYYPTTNDRVSIGLKDIAYRAQIYKGNRLRDRYALQVIRALFASSQYDACINYWNEVQGFLPNGLIKQMIRPYIAGAYYRTGAVERAMRIYAECGDIASLIFCAGKQEDKITEIEQLELLYKYDPDSPIFPKILQEQISKTEASIEGYWDKPIWNTLLGLRNFAWKVAREGKATNRAMWYYTAAYLSDQNGDTQTALDLLAKAEKSYGNSYIRESIMILRIYLDAKTCSCNIAYEQRLLEQLRWLDNKIRDNIDDKVRQKTISNGFWGNYSYYYWNDMLRKIVLSAVVPRYIAHGNYIRAIQLANMADNNLLNIRNNHDVNMEQVYAQAIALWVGGFQYWFDKDEMAVLERNNEAFRAVCVEEEQLTSFYEPCNEGDAGVLFMKTTDILKSLLQLSGLRSLSDQKLGRVLMSLGYKRVKKDGRYGYLLRLRKPSVPDSLLSELESMVEVQVPEEPEEIELAQLPVARIGRVQRQQE